MATFNEAVFILCMVSLVGLFLYKLYNALNGFSLYDFTIAIILWVAGLMLYGVSFMVAITTYDSIIISQFFKFLLLPIGLTTLFTIIELFITMQAAAQNTQRGSYKANELTDYRARF